MMAVGSIYVPTEAGRRRDASLEESHLLNMTIAGLLECATEVANT
jgi:hypothetical protein